MNSFAYIFSAIKRYRVFFLVWIITLFVGYNLFDSGLRKEGFPDINVPIAIIDGTYLVDSSTQIDSEVIKPISNLLNSDSDIVETTSTAGDNNFNLSFELSEDVSMTDKIAKLKSEIAELNLNSAVSYNFIAIDPSKYSFEYDLIASVYSPDNSDSPQMLQKNGVLLADKLSQNENIISAKALELIDSKTDPFSGQAVDRELDYITSTVNGDTFTSINIGIVSKDGIDEVELFSLVDTELEDSAKELGYSHQISGSNAASVQFSIDQLLTNILTGLVAVLIVTLLIISYRSAIITALFIPTVLAVIMVILALLGQSLNVITLFAILLTLGLFVDDATVITEAIEAEYAANKKISLREVIRLAMNKITSASVAGTLTTLLVFTPLLFISGILGEFIIVLPLTVIFSLIASIIISLIFVPVMSFMFIRLFDDKLAFLNKFSILNEYIDNFGKKLSSLFLNIPKGKKGLIRIFAPIILSFAYIFFGMGIASSLEFDIFPNSKDGNDLVLTIDHGDSQNDIEVIKSNTDKITNAIINSKDASEVKSIYFEQNNSFNSLAYITLSPYTDRSLSYFDIRNSLNESLLALDLGSTKAEVNVVSSGPPKEEFPSVMRISSNNTDDINKLISEVKTFLSVNEFTLANEEVFAIEDTKISDTTIIQRANGIRYIDLSIKPSNDSSEAISLIKDSVLEEFNSKLGSFNLTDDSISFDVTQDSENTESFASTVSGVYIAFGLMLVLLVVLFNSFLQPFMILTAIPFALPGVFMGLKLTDNPLSFFVMIGLAGLIGIVVNNTIMLIDFYNQQRNLGIELKQAIANSLEARIRPLIATTLTTIAALVPLVIYDPFWTALATTIVFGLFSSTILVILVFPYYLYISEIVRGHIKKKIKSISRLA